MFAPTEFGRNTGLLAFFLKPLQRPIDRFIFFDYNDRHSLPPFPFANPVAMGNSWDSVFLAMNRRFTEYPPGEIHRIQNQKNRSSGAHPVKG